MILANKLNILWDIGMEKDDTTNLERQWNAPLQNHCIGNSSVFYKHVLSSNLFNNNYNYYNIGCIYT